MTFVDPPLPIGIGWLSMSLYRRTTERDPFLGELAEVVEGIGTAVTIDGWMTALDDAWEQLVTSSPGAAAWVADYQAAKIAAGDTGLGMTFGDTTRIVGRRGYGGFEVSYPASLLTSADEPVGAMRSAIIAALDRHVQKVGLDVPLFSTVVQRTETEPTR